MRFLLVLLSLLLLSTAVSAQTASMFPFALPPFDASQSATNVSWMNDKAAGANGFIKVQGEHFVDGKGDLVRFWGVNLNFQGAFPSKVEAQRVAARLAKFGFNAARMHHYEGNAAPNGLWKAWGIGSNRLLLPREIDPEQLDRFDYFAAELMKRGIYLDLNLHVGRKAVAADGVLQAGFLPDKDKGVNLYDEKLISLQEEFARTLLNHVNPYTKRAYKDEPGVCAVEVVNENSLLGLWLEDKLGNLPELYATQLQGRWNDWLRAKYPSNFLWRAAWTELDDPLDPTDLMVLPLPTNIINPNAPDSRIQIGLESLRRLKLATTGGGIGQTAVDQFGGYNLDGYSRPSLRASLNTTGNVAWAYKIQRDNLALQPNQPYTLSFWARSSVRRRISINLWQDRSPFRFEGFSGFADLSSAWKQYSFVFRATDPDPNHSRLEWNLGAAPGLVDLSDVQLRVGGRIAPPDEWKLSQDKDDDKIPLIQLKTSPMLVARRDYAEFLASIERAHLRRMRRLLKDELKVRVPIWQTQAQFGGWGGLWREMESDAIDVHAYWKHPSFRGADWGDQWTVQNASMTKAPGIDPMSGMSFFRAPGKPFVMTEWNSGQPNDFGAESLLMLASYAAWQDWAAVYVFDYHSSGPYDRDFYQGFFSIDSQPVKMATSPAAALLFRRPTRGLPGDVWPARDAVTLTLPRDTFWNEVASNGGPPSAAPAVNTWQNAFASRTAPLAGKVYTRFGNAIFPIASRVELSTAKQYSSDTKQIEWKRDPGLYTLNSPRSKLAIGFLGGREINLDELRIAAPKSRNNFAAISLSSLDGEPVPSSHRLLLTAAGRAENVGMGWNAARNSVGNQWGTGPTRVEGIDARIALLTDAKRAKVWALDTTGGRRSQVSASLRGGVLRFSIAPRWETLWYEIVWE